jgi:hypothetical protein
VTLADFGLVTAPPEVAALPRVGASLLGVDLGCGCLGT